MIDSLRIASILAHPDLNLFSGRPISSNPASDESFARAKVWIHNCLTSQEHAFCPKLNQPHMSSFLQKSLGEPGVPTRLIDVGLSDGSQEPKLILSSASRLSINWEYVALSHCWGQAQLYRIHNDDTRIDLESWMEDQKNLAEIKRKPLTTTSETLEQRLQQIPMSTLPRTFRDAITLTRGLGLRYIWIDSLCIIQNSKSDWKEEAARMADIYKNSYVTIAAESSRDSHEGMFGERILAFQPIEVPFHSKTWAICDILYIRQALDDWETCVNGTGSALRSRAWVLQESLLAPRTIRVSSQQMFWECRSKSLAEGNLTPILPRGKGREKKWNWSRNKRFLVGAENELGDSETDSEDMKGQGLTAKDVMYLQWSSIIRDYSHRKLSVSSDIFPALEGLAREFNTRLNDTYIAGLWKRDLLRGLLWKVEGSKPGELPLEATPYRAPSWSWASTFGGIISDNSECVHRVGNYHVEIINIQIYLEGDLALGSNVSHYGGITGGSLTLRGRWTSCSRWPRFEEGNYDNSSPLFRYSEEGFGNMFRYLDYSLDVQYEARHKRGRTLSLLEIASWVQDKRNFPVVYFLILESGDFGDEKVFKRAGVVVLHKENANLEDHEQWVRDWEIREVTIV
jgi:hypothetical protein